MDSPTAALLARIGNTPGSAVLLGLMAIASFIGLAIAPSVIERNLFRPYWLVARRQYASLVTSAFLHADVAHLAFNALTFWFFGFPLERRIGTPAFVALYFFGLFVSDAGTYLRHRHERDYASLGASGAILAVLFASIVYFPSQSIYMLPLPVPIPAPLFAAGYLAFSVYASRRARGRINHDAHISGALAGIVFVMLTDFDAFGRAWRSVLG